MKRKKLLLKATVVESFGGALLLALGYAIFYFCMTLTFIIGGWLGTLTTMVYATKAVGLVTFVLMGVLAILYQENKEKG